METEIFRTESKLRIQNSKLQPLNSRNSNVQAFNLQDFKL